VKITADTNVLVRVIMGDDERQAAVAQEALALADEIVVTLPVLCELAWVLSRGYRTPAPRLAEVIRNLSDTANVVLDRPAVDAGLEMLASGGDFADGVIAHEGEWLGAAEFVSFDREAVTLLAAQGRAARLL
jgi:predicted nucleic-acid-binding protein